MERHTRRLFLVVTITRLDTHTHRGLHFPLTLGSIFYFCEYRVLSIVHVLTARETPLGSGVSKKFKWGKKLGNLIICFI